MLCNHAGFIVDHATFRPQDIMSIPNDLLRSRATTIQERAKNNASTQRRQDDERQEKVHEIQQS